jgi:hypothetical protein
MKVITSTTYSRNWGLVAPIIALKFLQDDHPFLLWFIGVNSSNPLPFHGHFRWVQRDFFASNYLGLHPYLNNY